MNSFYGSILRSYSSAMKTCHALSSSVVLVFDPINGNKI